MIWQANEPMASAVGLCSTKEIWRTNAVAASNNGSTGPVLELRNLGVAKRRYQLTLMQAVAGGIRCENTTAWLTGEEACNFYDGNGDVIAGWTEAIVQGSKEWVKQFEAGDVSENLLQGQTGLNIGAGFVIRDPVSLGSQ